MPARGKYDGTMSEGRDTGTFPVKRGLAEMMKGGVIMDVVTPEQAKIAEDAGAVAVMALERVPADIRRDGGVARMSDPEMIEGIEAAVSIPVMAKARIGHFVEAQILQALGVDFVDESEVLTPADETHHIDKFAFDVPFVCGATNLGEALRRISEGAAMIRSKGEAGTGNVVEAVRHLRSIIGDIKRITQSDSAELFEWAKQLQAPLPLVQELADLVVERAAFLAAGGVGGEVHVLQHEVHGLALEHRQPLGGGARVDGVDLVQRQQHVQRGGDGRVVVDDQDGGHQVVAARPCAWRGRARCWRPSRPARRPRRCRSPRARPRRRRGTRAAGAPCPPGP
jgi:pyridoxal 5'-phosphate synthase pdxS subunit